MARKQIINPLVGFGQRSIGPYANRIGGSTYARHVALRGPVAQLHAYGADANGQLWGLEQGDGSLTFARATEASVTDAFGQVRTALVDELRFLYGRRVENLAAATATPATQDITVVSGKEYQVSIGAGSASGATAVCSDAFTGTLTGDASNMQAFDTAKTASSTTLTVTITGAVTDLQVEDVTGQADQNPAKYVSKGVESGDYHGVGVDGVAYFNYANGNTVSGNVVTEAKGQTLRSDSLGSERDLSDWTLVRSTLGGSVTALDGTTLTNNGLIPNSGEGLTYQYLPVETELINGMPYVYEVFLKAGNSTWAVVAVTDSNSDSITQYFELSGAGGVGVHSGGGTVEIDLMSDGWYRCRILFTNGVGSDPATGYVYAVDGDNNTTTIGSDGVKVWHYTDGATIKLGWYDWRALYESFATTNQLVDSNDFTAYDLIGVGVTLTPAYMVSPDGTSDATRYESGASAVNLEDRYNTGSSVNGETWTYSLWMISNTGSAQNIRILVSSDTEDESSEKLVSVPTTWTRFEVTETFTITTRPQIKGGIRNQVDNYNKDVSLFGSQLEQQQVATSYVPTSGGTATRSADDGGKAFAYSNWSQTEGSWIADVWLSVIGGATRNTILTTHNGNTGQLYENGNFLYSRDGSSSSNDPTNLSGSEDEQIRCALDFGTGDTMEVGKRNITTTGSFTWDLTPANYDGEYDTNNIINIAYTAAGPIGIRDLYGYTTRLGKDYIEENF